MIRTILSLFGITFTVESQSRIDPITFSQRYNNESGENYVYQGFQPFRNEKGEWVVERKVVCEPTAWDQGAAIRFRILELYNGSDGVRERRLGEMWYYDRPPQGSPYKTTQEQALLMGALASGELRGRYAESIVHDLFVDLFVLDEQPDSLMRKYLPEVVAFWEDH